MNDKNITTHYELPTGAIAILGHVLPTAVWYKDEAKQARLIVDAVAAEDALPEVPESLKPEKDETEDAFKARVDAWGSPILIVNWTDRQKAAVKACVRYYIKNGNLTATSNLVAIINLLQLDEE